MIRRLAALFAGLWLYGFSMAVMIRAAVGLDPWDVFHQGLTRHILLSFGAVTAATGVVVLLAELLDGAFCRSSENSPDGDAGRPESA